MGSIITNMIKFGPLMLKSFKSSVILKVKVQEKEFQCNLLVWIDDWKENLLHSLDSVYNLFKKLLQTHDIDISMYDIW
jgi:hypothetical protein